METCWKRGSVKLKAAGFSAAWYPTFQRQKPQKWLHCSESDLLFKVSLQHCLLKRWSGPWQRKFMELWTQSERRCASTLTAKSKHQQWVLEKLILWASSENVEVEGLTVKGVKNKLEFFWVKKREGQPLLAKEKGENQKGLRTRGRPRLVEPNRPFFKD